MFGANQAHYSFPNLFYNQVLLAWNKETLIRKLQYGIKNLLTLIHLAFFFTYIIYYFLSFLHKKNNPLWET